MKLAPILALLVSSSLAFAQQTSTVNGVPDQAVGGNLTFGPSTTSSAALTVLPGVAPSAPNEGDCWNIAGYLGCYNGSEFISYLGTNGAAPFVQGLPVVATGSHTGASSQNYIDISFLVGSDFCAKLLAGINQAIANSSAARTTLDARNFYTNQTCAANPFSTIPTTGDFPVTILMPAVAVTTVVPWGPIESNDVVIKGKGQGGLSILQAGSGYPSAAVTSYSITSNVITVETATQNFTAGQTVSLSGFGTSTFLNSVQLVASATGLTTTQFEAPYTHANTSATEAGFASSPLITFGNCATFPGNYYSRIEDWRITANGNSPGTLVTMCGMQEGSGWQRVNLIGNNDSTATGDLVLEIGSGNQIWEDAEFNSTGANNAFTYAGGVESVILLRATFNDTAYSNKGLCALNYANSTFQAYGYGINIHAEGFASGVCVGSNVGFIGIGIDTTGTTTTNTVYVNSGGSGPGGVQLFSLRDNGNATNLVNDNSFATPRLTTASANPFGSHTGIAFYTNSQAAAQVTIASGTTINAGTCTPSAGSGGTSVTAQGVGPFSSLQWTATSDTSGVTGWGNPASPVLYILDTPGTNAFTYHTCNNSGSNVTTSASVTFNVGVK